MTHAQAQALLTYSFNHEITPEEEAVLDRLEQEWLTMCRATELESYDYYSMGNPFKMS